MSALNHSWDGTGNFWVNPIQEWMKNLCFIQYQRRIGGNVKLTIDADLQNFIEDLLIENWLYGQLCLW